MNRNQTEQNRIEWKWKVLIKMKQLFLVEFIFSFTILLQFYEILKQHAKAFPLLCIHKSGMSFSFSSLPWILGFVVVWFHFSVLGTKKISYFIFMPLIIHVLCYSAKRWTLTCCCRVQLKIYTPAVSCFEWKV